MTTNQRQPDGTWTPVVPSPDGTIVKAGSTGQITDAAGFLWGINSTGEVTVNGVADTSTWQVAAIGIKAGVVEQLSTTGSAYDKTVSQWTQNSTPFVTVWTPSADKTVITAPTTSTITDATGNVWGITNGQVTLNGKIDSTTLNVTSLAYVSGSVWQENASNLWWQWTGSWTPQGGTNVNPVTGQAPPPPPPPPPPTPTPTPAPTPTPTPPTSLAVSVVGHNIVNANGTPIQLRGVNISSLEGTPFYNDPWRGQSPNWAAIKSWGVNVVRLPLGEANWLGLCGATLANGVTPAIYQQTVAAAVAAANAAGMYVILDLHWIVEGNDTCPQGQNAMADSAHSLTFWTQVAEAYKNNPAVMFELFNEPQGNYPPTTADWNNYVNGQLASGYDTNCQAMVNAIRATGATNVIIQDGLNYASTFGNNNNAVTGYTDQPPGWFPAKDTLNPPQIAGGFHYYHGSTYEQGANTVLNKGIPILVTEYGDNNNASGNSQTLYGWADPGGRASQAINDPNFPGVSYVAWTWDAWAGVSSFILITDQNGTPTPYGAYVKAHYLARQAATQ